MLFLSLIIVTNKWYYLYRHDGLQRSDYTNEWSLFDIIEEWSFCENTSDTKT